MPSTTISSDEFVRAREPFLRYLAEQAATQRDASLRDIVAVAGGPGGVALVAVDVVNGFCREGALASARVGAIVPPIVDLFERAHAAGVRHMVLVCEGHSERAQEFNQYAPHCIMGTHEAEPVDELKALPFYQELRIVRKNSISPWHGQPDLGAWMRARLDEGLTAVIAVGDCTDLCLHQLALPLKLDANQLDRPLRVIVPRNTVQTYDLPRDVAASVGARPHDGDLLHEVFLYHLALNGVEVVGHIGD